MHPKNVNLKTVIQYIFFCFSAGYETGVSGYKHVYFNSTRQTLAIWILTVFAVIGLYESIRHVVTLLYTGACNKHIFQIPSFV